MKKYKLKFMRLDWTLFFTFALLYAVFLLGCYIFLSFEIKEIVYCWSIYIIILYLIKGKYPYWISRKKEVEYDKY